MRRATNLWSQVTAFQRLLAAARRAARGQRDSYAVARFLDRLEPECLALARALTGQTWRPGPVTTFDLFDPKPRRITVTPFADRVVHHALLAPLEPVFERRMIASSYACRAGKGSTRAVRHAQRLLRRYPYSLKLDVAGFFASLDHGVVLATLHRIVKDRPVLDLAARIVRGQAFGAPSATVGLPIGSLTSQWFANLVLDRLDHFVKETLRLPGYVRYMDDFVCFADSRDHLRAAHAAIAYYLEDNLKLRLKERVTRLAPANEGLPFLGWSIRRHVVRVRPQNLRRYRWRLRYRRWQFERGQISEAQFRDSVRSVYAHVAQGDTTGLRRSWPEMEDSW